MSILAISISPLTDDQARAVRVLEVHRVTPGQFLFNFDVESLAPDAKESLACLDAAGLVASWANGILLKPEVQEAYAAWQRAVTPQQLTRTNQ